MFEMKKNYYFSISFVLEKLHVFKSYFGMKSKTKMNRANWLIPILASFVILNCAFSCDPTPGPNPATSEVKIDGWGVSHMHGKFDYGFDMGDVEVKLGGTTNCLPTKPPSTLEDPFPALVLHSRETAFQLHSIHLNITGEAFILDHDASNEDKFYVKVNTGHMTFRMRAINLAPCDYDDNSLFWDATINFSYRYKAIYFDDPDQYCITKSRIDWDSFDFRPLNHFDDIDAISNWIKNDNEKAFIAVTDRAVAQIMTSQFKGKNLPEGENGRCRGHSAWTQLP